MARLVSQCFGGRKGGREYSGRSTKHKRLYRPGRPPNKKNIFLNI